MIPFKNDSAAVAIDVGRNMPTYKAGLRNYDIVTHLGENNSLTYMPVDISMNIKTV